MHNRDRQRSLGFPEPLWIEKILSVGPYLLILLASALGFTLWMLILLASLYISDLPTYPSVLVLDGILLNGAYVRALYQQERRWRSVRAVQGSWPFLLLALASLLLINGVLLGLAVMLRIPGYGDPRWHP